MTAGAGLFLQQRLDAGEQVRIVWAMLAGTAQAEAYARSKADAVLCDMQHGLIGFSEMQAMVQAIQRGGKPALVRPPLDDFAMVSRALDAGAAAIIMPMINSTEDAKRLVCAAKYPPLGERSWGPYSALNASGLDAAAYLSGANRLTRVFGMVETRQALEALNDIVAVEGLDGVFVGPYDLSISLSGGKTAGAHYEGVRNALDGIVKSTRNAGKIPGIYASNREQVREFSDIGFQLISVSSDTAILGAGLASVME